MAKPTNRTIPTSRACGHSGSNILAEFLASQSGLVSLVSDYDADGLSSAVLMESFLRRTDRSFSLRTPVQDRNIWDTPTERWLAADAALAIVMDLGCRGDKLFPVPTLFIDHHKDNPPSPDDLLYAGYDRDPVPTTAGLVWELVRDEVPEKKWLAALGTYGDLGSKAPFDYLQEIKKEFTAKALGEVVSLVNAARRIASPRVDLALSLLRRYDDPKSLVKARDPELLELEELRERVRTETERCKQAAPVFADEVALVMASSDCQVHPIIAQIWRTRLPKYYVLVANDGYEEGKIHFSGRSRGDKMILQKLRSLPSWAEDAGFGQGHDQAAGGVVDLEMWKQILSELGFEG
ncbi:MAG: DHH family phosphoesterase [Candidatus Eremiobacteraeota bacterium]|nr:DHH family phosphoesterase [Candidatus Eremiobacteraeota bacterium]